MTKSKICGHVKLLSSNFKFFSVFLAATENENLIY